MRALPDEPRANWGMGKKMYRGIERIGGKGCRRSRELERRRVEP
jgi:hypothetical protein